MAIASEFDWRWVVALFWCTSGIVILSLSFYKHRGQTNNLRKAGLPMPQWSWLTGHLLPLKPYLDRHPADIQTNSVISDMAHCEFSKTDMFYLDFWPLAPKPILAVLDPLAANEVVNKFTLSKPEHFQHNFKALAGGPNLFTMPDDDWKPWRAMFNPGFSAGYMLAQVPCMVEQVAVFYNKLQDHAGKGMFILEELTLRLTMDVIISVALDTNLDYQRSENVLASTMRNQVTWHIFGNEMNPLVRWNPIRPLKQFYNGWVMDRYISKELQKNFERRQQKQKSKSVMTLVLEGYNANNTISSDALDPHFTEFAIHQIRLMLFAGHDTTSSTICWTFYLLAKHPKIIAAVQKEHDDVFGADPSMAAEKLKKDPSLLNKTPLTLAVVKETLRLFPPASSMRAGRPGVSLTDRHGNLYPTDNVLVWIMHFGLQRNPRVWPRPEEFLPERWLVEPGHELYPPTGGYRPFEYGPRNCIGQTLVYIELRLVLIMTLRLFDVQPAYQEFDAKADAGLLRKMRLQLGLENGIKTFKGERAYMVEIGGAHPSDGLPCRVELAERKGE